LKPHGCEVNLPS